MQEPIWGAVRFVVAFAAVLLLAGGVSRWLAVQARGARPAALAVLGAVGLGGARQVCLVRVGRRLLILGVAEKQVQLLSEITDAEEIAELTGQSAAASGATAPFARVFEAARAGMRRAGRPHE